MSRNYIKEYLALDAAIDSVKDKQMSLRAAAKQFKVPVTTLSNHVNGVYCNRKSTEKFTSKYINTLKFGAN